MRTLPLLVLRALLRKGNWLRFASVLASDTFNNMIFRRLYEHIKTLHGQTEGDLNVEALMADLEISYQDRQDFLAELRDVVIEIQEIEDIDPDLLESKVRDFVQRELAVQAAQYVGTKSGSPDFDVNVLADYVTRALEVGSSLNAEVVDLFAADLSRTADPGSVRYGFGFSDKLDTCLFGGHGLGELAIVLAPPNRGKTSLLCAAGAAAAAQGHRVLHISLETHTYKVIRRYDQALTKLSRMELDDNQALVEQGRKVLAEKGGKVFVKDWSHSDVSAADIERTVHKMWAKGDLVDYIILDYMELAHPIGANKRHEMRHVHGATCMDMRKLAAKLNVPVLTAWQVNRSGADQEMLKVTDVSECWDIVKHADTIIALNRNQIELFGHRARLAILKNREDSVIGAFPIYCDMGRMIFRDLVDADHMPKDVTIAAPETHSD